MVQRFNLEERTNFLKQFGSHAMAFSTMQPNMQYIDVPESGYLAYKPCLGTRFILGDPICGIGDRLELVREAEKEHKGNFYAQISEEFGRTLEEIGYYVNSFGVESVVDLTDFKISWNKREDLKRWISAISKQRNLTITENPKDLDLDEVKKVSDEWIKSKPTKKELSFMARPFILGEEPDVRKFYAFENGRLLGFCSFDPCYSEGKIKSYTLNHTRYTEDSPKGMYDYLIVHGLDIFKKEGLSEINLGISPLHDRDTTRLKGSKISDIMGEFVYNHMSWKYGFKQLGFHKDRYKVPKHQVYVASKKPFILFDIMKLMKVNGVI